MSEAQPQTLAGLLLLRAARTPDRRAYLFLESDAVEDGENGDAGQPSLTYRQLLERAQAIAGALQQELSPGARVLLLYPPGLDFVTAFFGCQLGGFVAVPAYPPDPARLGRSVPRLQAIAADAEVACVLTTALIQSMAEALAEQSPELARLRWIASDAVPESAGERWKDPAASPHDLAFLQYTSGSTAEPKGVMVSHANVLHNSAAIHRLAGHTPDSVYVCWLPSYHDMGLIGGILQPLFGGLLGVLLSPVSFLQEPARWLRALSRFGGTTTPFPNFALDLCVRKVPAAAREGLDLGSLRVACNGAEPVRWESLQRFTEAFAPHGFRAEAHYPAYGLAEATLLVTGGARPGLPRKLWLDRRALASGRVAAAPEGAGQALCVIGCGQSLPDQELIIVDPETLQRCPEDRVGEIWLRGPSVAQGYWRRPAQTAEVFGARLSSGEGPFLRTGDLGFLHGAELVITGRRKDLIILRGRNLYPQDVERSVEQAVPALRSGCVAAFAVELEGEERLALVAEVNTRAGPVDPEAIWSALQEVVAREHEAGLSLALLLEPGTIPKTSSGKLQRHLCKAGLLAGTLGETHRFAAARPATRAAAVAPAAAPDAPATPEAGSAARADALIAHLRELTGERYSALWADERRTLPPALISELGRAGAMGLQAPRDAGGLSLSTSDMLRVVEQLGAVDLTLSTFVGMHNSLGLRPILRHAQPALRDELVPLLASGRGIGAFALSEAQAGSNVRALQSVAEPAGEGRFLLRGAKMWIGSAAWASTLNVFVRSPGRDGQPPGTHAFVVRGDAPGLRLGGELMTLGLRGMVQSELFLEGVPALESQLLGRPGGGLEVAAESLNLGRLGIVAMCTGALKRAARLALRYARRRTVQSGRLLDSPLTLLGLEELGAVIGGLDALWQWVARRLDRGQPVPDELYAACKIAAPELACASLDSVMQLLGGRGYLEPDELPRLARDARVFRIGEGPTEALQLFLGARLALDGGLLAFLRAELEAADLAALLEDAARTLASRKATPPGLRHALLGELAAHATLAAVARKAAPARAAAWLLARFQSLLASALGERAAAADGLRAAEVEGFLESAAAGAGDVEPGAPGVAWEKLPREAPETPAAGGSLGSSGREEPEADGSGAIYQQLSARLSRLDRRSTRYQYDPERDICWERFDEPGDFIGERLLSSERIDPALWRDRPEVRRLLQWMMAVNICDRFTALEEALLRFSAQERARLGQSRSLELFDAEERKHVATFRRLGGLLRAQRPALLPEMDAYRAECEARLGAALEMSSARYESRREFHYSTWLLMLFFEEYTVFLYRVLLQSEGALQPTWLSAHRAHAQEEAQHVLTDAAFLSAMRVSDEERYAWSKRVFEYVVREFGALFALLNPHVVAACTRLHPELGGQLKAAPAETPALVSMLQDRAFAQTRAAAPYFAAVASRTQAVRAGLAGSAAAAEVRAWLSSWLAAWLEEEAGARPEAAPSALDPQRSFFSYGLDSLRLISLSGDLSRAFGRRLSPTAAYDHPDLARLAEHVAAAPLLAPAKSPALQRPGPLPLGARQARLYRLCEAHPGLVLDHLTEVFALEPVVPQALETALLALAARHEPLRTEVRTGPAGPAQYVLPRLERAPLLVASCEGTGDAFEQEVRGVALRQDRTPFDPGRGPLWRATLLTGGEGQAALVLTLHHLIGDGWSMALARRELAALYEAALAGGGAALPALPAQQADLAAQERAFLSSDEAAAARAWWRERLEGHPAIQEARAPAPTCACAALVRPLPQPLEGRLAELARAHHVSLYLVLLTLFHRVLQRREATDDLLLGTHLFNRPSETERSLVGYFVNVLILRAGLGRELPLSEALARMHAAWIDALEHALPVSEVVAAVRPDLLSERFLPARSAFNMLALSQGGADDSQGSSLRKRPELAPPPGFMFFEQMLLVAPDPAGQLWFTLWFDEGLVPRDRAEGLLAELFEELRLAAQRPVSAAAAGRELQA